MQDVPDKGNMFYKAVRLDRKVGGQSFARGLSPPDGLTEGEANDDTGRKD